VVWEFEEDIEKSWGKQIYFEENLYPFTIEIVNSRIRNETSYKPIRTCLVFPLQESKREIRESN
jgi:hypothetical protein